MSCFDRIRQKSYSIPSMIGGPIPIGVFLFESSPLELYKGHYKQLQAATRLAQTAITYNVTDKNKSTTGRLQLLV